MKTYTLTEQQIENLLKELQEIPVKYIYNSMSMLISILKEQQKVEENEETGQQRHSGNTEDI